MDTERTELFELVRDLEQRVTALEQASAADAKPQADKKK